MTMARGILTVGLILTAVTGCDKASRPERLNAPSEALVRPGTPPSELPVVLFHVFGEGADPRMVPVALVDSGRLHKVGLPPLGWVLMDAAYLRSGHDYPIYRHGAPAGSARVIQGMWERPESPVYSLPGCTELTPLARVKLDGVTANDFTVEYLATSRPLGSSREGRVMSKPAALALGRRIAATASAGSFGARAVDSLDLHVAAIHTGATTSPTLVVTAFEPDITPPSRGTRARHLFVIADRDSTGAYSASLTHRAYGSMSGIHFRRFIDQLDVDGDGIDELIAEGWQFEGETHLLVLGWREGAWREVFRSPTRWCLDG